MVFEKLNCRTFSFLYLTTSSIISLFDAQSTKIENKYHMSH